MFIFGLVLTMIALVFLFIMFDIIISLIIVAKNIVVDVFNKISKLFS